MDLLIDIGITESRALLISEGSPRSIYIEDYSIKNISGNIYKGRVENITKSLGCAFVNIGEEKDAMLHFDDSTQDVNKGDEILVQVVREPLGNKGARVTMNLSLPSKNSVLLVGSSDINISRKINNSNRRNELFNLGKSLTTYGDDLGIIFRTSCESIPNHEIEKEFHYTKNVWEKINRTWKYIKGEALLFESSSFLGYIKREYINPNISKIYINRYDKQEEILEFIKDNDLSIEVSSIEAGIDRLPLIKESIEYALSRKFNTKGGGNIVVDETEALTIIDINSASLSNNIDHEKNFLKVNLESIDKISQILSLRSSCGIILIDFINMKEESSRNAVQNEIQNKFSEYNIKAKVHGFTSLGILEISRARKAKPLKDFIYLREEGSRETTEYSLKNMENDLLRAFYKMTKSNFKVNVSEEIYNLIEKINFKKSLLSTYSINIEVLKLKDFKGYYILKDGESGFARISIGKKNYIGKIDEFNEDETSLTINITKMK